MIDHQNAELYFATHHRGAEWSAFPPEMRAASIPSARRILSRGLGRAMRDDEPEYREGDRTRDEFAVYEQALHLLVNSKWPNAQVGAPYPVAMLSNDAATANTSGTALPGGYTLYAPEALRWLGMTGGAAIRG